MSDDLISRKALINILNILKGVDKDWLLTINQIIDFIEDQPIAFDKEKVIEEIKEYSKTVPLYWNCNGGDLVNKIIDIIEKGGVE